jgi:transposase
MSKRILKQWRLPDEIWEFMEPLLPESKKEYKTGRPRLNLRNVADGVFYVLRTGAQWKAAPREFGSGSSLHDYFQSWVGAGVFWKLWQQGLLEYDEMAGIKWDWQSIDGAITKAPLGGKKNRTKSNGPSKIWNQEKPSYRRRRRSVSFGNVIRANTRQSAVSTNSREYDFTKARGQTSYLRR